MSRTDDPDRSVSETDPRDDAGESLEAMIERADHAFAAESFGTTAHEQGRGEPLDDRLEEELPDQPTSEVDLAIEDDDAPDTEPKMIGEIVRERDPYVSPEDAAMSVRDRAPGATDHRDDEYVDLYDHSIGDEAP